mmetsp:Transcript_1840/g.5377  ORF Transcript_1840/g.5377 Transcript_1840/m.5377 type:complete len:210 (+) Transcript_1840:644-1273(+)
MMGTFSPRANRRRSFPSRTSGSSPFVVSSIIWISPFFSRSPALGRPSWILSTRSHLTPPASSASAVPWVARMPKPSSARSLATGTMASLKVSVMVMNTLPLRGSFWPAARAALANAALKSLSMPITSPVDRISGPNRVSAPGNLSKGSTASFTATWFSVGSSVNPISGSVLPAISRDAYLTMGCPTALATKGTVRDARGLASMMYTWLS